MNMRKILAIVGALIAVGLGITVLSTAQQALADRVGPNPETEDRFTQGGLGEFYSEEGRDTYYGGASGQEFGDVRSDIAESDSEVIGANSAYYASGECHSDREQEACQ
jgi:hypothetical protein